MTLGWSIQPREVKETSAGGTGTAAAGAKEDSSSAALAAADQLRDLKHSISKEAKDGK